MISKLTFCKEKFPVADYSKESTLPSLGKLCENEFGICSELSEDDGLYVGYGFIRDIFPYRMQDLYTRTLKDTDLDVAILENQHIKATFAPKLGGKLLSLIDKHENRELLFKNSVIRPSNLALRNAWTSGGVEWNIGMVGHSPFTCSTLFTTSLRMYEYERIRKVTYQMDFYIPKDSRLLHCRMRIVNNNNYVVPMYWWSNIAVCEDKNSRVIVPADCAYTSEIINGNRTVMKLPIPYCDGFDATYPVNTADLSRDYFYRTDDNKPHYIAYVDKDGYGLVQTSTSRLKGRKLFVWGQGTGAAHWKDFLSLPGQGNYVEIQAGLARTQYEHLPMQPNTAWEWIEVYGAIKCNPKKAHGDFAAAQKEVENKLSRLVKIDDLEKELKNTKESMALIKGEKCIFGGSAWGQLENTLRKSLGESPLSSHLDFGKTGKAQAAWVSLLKSGTVGEHNPDAAPESWMLQSEFTKMLEDAVLNKDKDNWYAWLQLGAIYLCQNKFELADKALKQSIKCEKNSWSYYCLAVLSSHSKNLKNAKKFAQAALKLKSDDISLLRATFLILKNCEAYSDIIAWYEKSTKKIKDDSRVRIYYLIALANSNRYNEAYDLLLENRESVLDDVKEEEVCISDLYAFIMQKKAEENGETLDELEIPRDLDFRVKPEKYTFR